MLAINAISGGVGAASGAGEIMGSFAPAFIADSPGVDVGIMRASATQARDIIKGMDIGRHWRDTLRFD